ncbi:Xaa-Pro peptidase family protein [Paenibacillus sp. MER TA 81-3]|uniref:M24 family metallopeptidase n=1 Tax=Paenibacillus sp. MER TA 81-3 TaxID=2939573 RepID=UPI00203AF99E|nr:Xaa-Pro peptidase family protein [Paenibacillus sp. MER TA 81-3]MCM3338630.1 Xaa-Pro peptidase family protein [Paenibacillus sp. MER TA 81-3]
MNEKWNSLMKSMEKESLTALLITDPKHVYYLTGFACDPHERFLGLIITQHEEPALIVPALDGDKAASTSSVKRIATHTDTDNPYDVLKQHLPHGLPLLGIEKNHMSLQRFETLDHAVQAQRYADAGPILQSMRLIKSEEELLRMKEAVNLIEDVLRQCVSQVKTGMTEIEVVAELEYLMKKLGSDGPSFSTMVLAGENAALPHGIPGTRKIQEGELLLFDLGVYLNGYASDITRTFAVGEVNAKCKEIYDTVLAANETAIAAVKPGVTFGSLDRTARQVITEKGYGQYFTHRLGHGLGIDVHEYPSIHSQNDDLLQSGMTFTIEPGIYVPQVAGVRIEDDVAVTETGVTVLTSYPKELTVIGV